MTAFVDMTAKLGGMVAQLEETALVPILSPHSGFADWSAKLVYDGAAAGSNCRHTSTDGQSTGLLKGPFDDVRVYACGHMQCG